ncbi:ABC transporter ATP-binding protein [Micromonospora sp. WMMD1128]|uniref:ABC transporter ATP-binding protein n=1 Tax=unclassified Micromonospora TaxID=2617518 RepID=UPI00248B856A|nr:MULTISPECIES: ABC transporter ATP-binding protein [unclassified Micromonospora]WBB75885.1 ABC transporter ATP-binding protein [Micromonospora sp. WMMD1128]WFE36326.1 ABC transporter ATP-binding protein [Micromonospora sp. WMMD975]
MLTLEGLSAGYHGLQILHQLDLRVAEGEIVAIVGANGAGKTTTLKAISGLIRPTAGTITFDGRRADGVRPSELVGRGLLHVAEGRALFGPLSVEENLRMGGWTRGRKPLDEPLREVYDLFPILAERRAQAAETLSGGQQQMLAIGRALMAGPRLLLLDEPSTGLSPKLTWTVLDAIRAIRDRGVSVLLVEQNAAHALNLADRAYVLESGSLVLDGPGPELARDDRVRAAYLGL